MKTILLFIITLFSLAVSAQTGEDQLQKQLKLTEKELNEAYSKLQAKLGNSKDRTNLIKSQKAWLSYRETNCKFISKEESEGGVIANKMKTSCMIQTTEERIAVIKELIAVF